LEKSMPVLPKVPVSTSTRFKRGSLSSLEGAACGYRW
jgi:hypothetical protein